MLFPKALTFVQKVTRYIAGQTAVATIVATIAICLLITLVQSVKFIELIVNKGLPVSEFIRMSLLAAPRYLVYLVPVVMFGATLFTYNRMINDSELVVLRAAGFSRARLALAGLIVAAASSLFCYSLTLYLMPATQLELRSIILQVRSEWGAALLKEGQFTTVGDHTTIYIKERKANGELVNVFYHNTEDQLTIIAERGAIVDTEDGPRILVVNGNKQSFKDGRLHVLQFDRSTLDLGMNQQVQKLRWAEPHERYLPDLLSPDLSNPGDREHQDTLIAEGHSRLTTPILPVTLAALAMAIILGGEFSRRGQLKHVLSAIVVMIAVYVNHIWLSNISARQPWLIPASYANALLPLAVALYFIIRPRRFRKRFKSDMTAGSAETA